MCILIIELFSFCVTVEWPKDILPELPLKLSDAHGRCDQITLLLMTSGALCIVTSYCGTRIIKKTHIKSIWNSHANLSFITLINVMYLLKGERERTLKKCIWKSAQQHTREKQRWVNTVTFSLQRVKTVSNWRWIDWGLTLQKGLYWAAFKTEHTLIQMQAWIAHTHSQSIWAKLQILTRKMPLISSLSLASISLMLSLMANKTTLSSWVLERCRSLQSKVMEPKPRVNSLKEPQAHPYGRGICGRSMQGSPAIQTKGQMDPSVYDALKTMTVSDVQLIVIHKHW